MTVPPSPPALRRFYRHLVATLAAQLAVVLVGIALDGPLAWPTIIVLLTTFVLAAHASVVFAPRRSDVGPGAR